MNYIFPVAGDYRITSNFGARRHPISGSMRQHSGIDIAAITGTPVVSPISGRVVYAGPAGGYGNQVRIMGSDGVTHSFSHLNDINVKYGDNVSGGLQLGGVGSTGNSTGPHLHYETSRNGRKFNPLSILNKASSYIDDAVRIGGRLIAGDYIGAATEGAKTAGDIAGGEGGNCGINPICHLREWIRETGFFERLALVILAFIFIAVALFMLKSNVIESTVNTVKKGIA